jgi:predicted component of type VI protein secretion system
MKLSLVVMTAGKTAGQAIPIKLSQFLIGRDPQCHLRPASAVISKRHCAVLVKDGKVVVRDFDSTNGTFVNDTQVNGERELCHDDTLKVGPLSFRVVLEATAPVNKPTPPPPKAVEPSDDESMAAMLLSLQDDAASPTTAGKVDRDGVPEGSTVMDIASPLAAENAAPQEEPSKEPDKKAEPAQKVMGNTSSAAKAILDKYTRRPRA